MDNYGSISRCRNLKGFCLLIFVFSMQMGISHEAKSQGVLQLDQFLNSADGDMKNVYRDLFFGNQPTIYLSEGGSIEYPESEYAQMVRATPSNMAQLTAENEQFRTVKVLQIKIEEDSQINTVRLRGDQLGSFKNLLVILVISEVPMSASQVSAMFSGFEDSTVTILYQVSLPQ